MALGLSFQQGKVRGTYQHSHTASSEEDSARQIFSIVVCDLGLELYEAYPFPAEDVDGLDVDLAKLVGCVMESMVCVLLRFEGALKSVDPILEGGEIK